MVDSSGYYSSYLDLPSLPLIPYEFRCSGTEQSLLECVKETISCYSSDSYFKITCQGIKTLFYFVVYCWCYIAKCKHHDIRLAGASYSTIGRVEVCVNGTWGTVCRNSFDDIDARVVCQHLGYSPYG